MTASMASAEVAQKTSIPPATVGLMAVATGIAVANLYYCQPLLRAMITNLHAPERLLGWIPAMTQAGAALGMLLFVPLGDIVNRKDLTVRMCFSVAVTTLLVGLSPSIIFLLAASFVLGLTCNIPHLILPFAAQIAPPEERGKVVGMVISGLLIGILLARAASGVLGASLGWRPVYWLASGLMLLLALSLRYLLPDTQPSVQISYWRLIRSLPDLLLHERVIQETAGTGAILFGAFNAFWTTLILLLETPPYHYGERTVGAFGLVAAGGAAVAPAVGRLMDRHSPRLGVRYAILLSLLAFGVLWIGSRSLWGIAAGVLLLDIGVQAGHVSNQTRIYSEFPEARSRANTVYMVCYFLGGACGSVFAVFGWRHFGWPGVCMSASILLFVGFVMHAWHGTRKDTAQGMSSAA